MNIRYEKKKFKQGFGFVIGCDEVGRGSLAGPVTACAVILDCSKLHKIDQNLLKQVKDSKQLSAKKREELASFIKQNFLWAIGEVSHKTIDKINIHNASLLAMRRAVENLSMCHCECSRSNLKTRDCHALRCIRSRNDKLFLVIDGKFTIPKFDMEQEAIIKGDNKIFSIAMASIVAKVYRDELMRKLNKKYSQYGFAQHKGYGTLHHRNMLTKHGLCPLHRKSFCLPR